MKRARIDLLHVKTSTAQQFAMESEDPFNDSDQVVALYERLVESFMSPCDISERYDVKEQLGKGAFGSVSKVEHLQTRNLAAIKTINLDKQWTSYQYVMAKISEP